MPEARQNSSKLAEMFASASSFSALVGTAVDVISVFMALLSFVESAPRAYRLKASNAAPPISTSIGTIPCLRAELFERELLSDKSKGPITGVTGSHDVRPPDWHSEDTDQKSSRSFLFETVTSRSTWNHPPGEFCSLTLRSNAYTVPSPKRLHCHSAPRGALTFVNNYHGLLWGLLLSS